MESKLTVEECISDCFKVLREEFKKYHFTVQRGIHNVATLIAHITSLKNIQSAAIDGTEIYKVDQNIQSVLMMAVETEIRTMKIVIAHSLDKLEKIHTDVVKQCDKVFSVYRSAVLSQFKHLSLSLDDVTENSATSCSIGDKIEVLDTFKKRFTDYHLGKMYSIAYCDAGDLNKLSDIWKVSDLISLEQDVACILA